MNKTTSFNIYTILIAVLLAGLISGVNPSRASLSEQQPDIAEQSTALKNKPYAITISGNTHFTESDLLGAAAAELQMFEQRGFRKADIDDAAFQMQSTYFLAGFAFAYVDSTYEQKGDSVQISFMVEEGARVFIDEIHFTGNSNVGQEILRGFFPKTARRFLRRQQEMIYIKSEVRDAVNSIRDYYRGEGFIDAVVKSPELDFIDDRTRVKIIIQIEEGLQYFINEVVLSGDVLPELDIELNRVKNEFIGKSYYARRRLLLRSNLEEAYDNIGFADAEFDIQMQKLNKQGKVNLEANITKGEIVRISDILVTGNNSTRESFVRQRLQFNPGDMYTNAKRRESFRKLFDSGLFSRITIELTPPEQGEERNLKLHVDEFPTREFYVEPGWGSYERLRLRAGVFEKNLFGTGRNWRIDGLVSTKGEIFTISYTDPWFLQTDITMNVPFFYERREEPSYTSEERGASVMFTRELSRNLMVTTGYLYQATTLFDLTEDAILPPGEDDYNKGTIGFHATWDTRDDIFYPTEGLRLYSGFDISLPAFGSDLDFGRINLGCRYFIELGQKYIIGLRATSGLIIPFREQDLIPISERFFNGGDSTVRSYKHSELGPKDSNNEPLGGLGYNVFSIELRKRFYKNFVATFYVDAGNVSPNRSLLENGFEHYDERSELFDATLNDFFSEFNFGIGVGLQYFLPVGPIRVDVAYNPDPKEIWNEDTWVAHFSLGMAF